MTFRRTATTPHRHSNAQCQVSTRRMLSFVAIASIIGASSAFAPLNNQRGGHINRKSSAGTLPATELPSEEGTKELSYSSLLRVIDEQHYKESVESCPYLPVETILSEEDNRNKEESNPSVYQSPIRPVLSVNTVNSLRSAAQRYFDSDGVTPGQKVTSLESVLSSLSEQHELGSALANELGEALTQRIFPLIRSSWSDDDAFTFKSRADEHFEEIGTSASQNETKEQQKPLLCVSSATIFAGGGYAGSKVAMTTLERDAALFVVHIDLGNDQSSTHDNNGTKGAIYLEALVDDSGSITNSIVGPLDPGQVVVHHSEQRTAAFMAPSNLRDLLDDDRAQTLDSLMRRQLLKTAESTRHYALRLVLTTRRSVEEGNFSNNSDAAPNSTPTFSEAPRAERSYRLRSFARVRDDKARYLTLSGLIDTKDHETHLWLGFDYLSRIDNPEYSVDTQQRLSDINKAIFHLEKAADLCPNDPRIYFQLASALGAKMDCEKTLLQEGDTVNESSEESLEQLAQVAAHLERSSVYESASVKLGINGIQDLTSCLNALAETKCKMGDFQNALNVIDQWAECGSIRSALAIEDMTISASEYTPSYEWMKSVSTGRNVAVKTVGDTPLFEADDIRLLVSSADRRFAQANGKQLSRYTMQYVGNSEVHLDDLCASDPELKQRMDYILQNRVYPLVRAAFSEDKEFGGETPAGPLCVYDSIFVRYNGDEARLAGRVGASQPLHQDGGIISVNIALNSHRDDSEDGFTGGGTFLEGLSADDGVSCIQRPVKPGHALLHHTTARHAGAPTTSGIRDILVIFLTARHPQDRTGSENTYRIERPMRLQTIAKQLPREKLIPCLELARENDPMNSEMCYWLGVHLLQGDYSDESDIRWMEICRGIESLQSATKLNPTDARAHYHLGMAISSRHKFAMRTRRLHLLPPPAEAAANLIAAFESAIRLENKCAASGCPNGINLAAAFLSLGDFMARLGNHEKAMDFLSQVESAIADMGELDENWAKSMLEEVTAVANYCSAELQKQKDASLVL